MSLEVLKDKLWLWMLGGKYPTAPGYTVLNGFVSGPLLRLESFSGGELWIKSTDPLPSGVAWGYWDKFGETGFILNNFAPFEKDGKIWSISDIQKSSKRGYLKCTPDAYWFWDMDKLQDIGPDGKYVEDTEDGVNYRKGTKPLMFACWRADFAGTDSKIDGIRRNWIPSGGHFSLHKYD
jgi:hypothetical protein